MKKMLSPKKFEFKKEFWFGVPKNLGSERKYGSQNTIRPKKILNLRGGSSRGFDF